MGQAAILILDYLNGASLNEAGCSYKVFSFSYIFDKDYDRKGNIVSKVKGGNINLTLSALPTDELMGWVFNPQKLVSGQLLRNDESAGIEECYLAFEQARCTKCKIKYSLDNEMQLGIQLTINAALITMGSIVFLNK